jgi:hypothetical protein
MLKDQRSVGEIFTRGNLPLFEKLADLGTARIPVPVIFLRGNIPRIFRLIFNLELVNPRNRILGLRALGSQFNRSHKSRQQRVKQASGFSYR